MITAIVEKTEVLPGGLIKLHTNKIPIHSKVEVSAVIKSTSKTKSHNIKTRHIGSNKGRIMMSDDFDQPLPELFWSGK